MLTGQYSHRNGVYTPDDALDPALDNIAKRLRDARATVRRWWASGT